MDLPSEALVKDFWAAMWQVQYAARYDNVPGSLRNFGKIANRNFEIWFTRHGVLKAFASGMLSGPTDLRIECRVARTYCASMLETTGLIRIYL